MDGAGGSGFVGFGARWKGFFFFGFGGSDIAESQATGANASHAGPKGESQVCSLIRKQTG